MMNPLLRRYLPLALCATTLLVSHATGLAQEEGEAKAPGGQSIFETIKEGGPLIMLIWAAIIGTSVTMVTFIIQNIMQLRKAKLAPPPLIAALQQTILNG